jgi:hypothetical protein
MTSPGLWMIIAAPVLVIVFVLVMRWATKEDSAVSKRGNEGDDEHPSNLP